MQIGLSNFLGIAVHCWWPGDRWRADGRAISNILSTVSLIGSLYLLFLIDVLFHLPVFIFVLIWFSHVKHFVNLFWNTSSNSILYYTAGCKEWEGHAVFTVPPPQCKHPKQPWGVASAATMIIVLLGVFVFTVPACFYGTLNLLFGQRGEYFGERRRQEKSSCTRGVRFVHWRGTD